jgi:Uma2 family endonuclease
MFRGLHYSYEEYLSLEEHSLTKHEYLDGEIYAMAGGMPGHAGLAARVIALLGQQRRAGCRVYSSDLRIRIAETGLSTYPDVTVICGATERAAEDNAAVVNPILLVEVTSKSTEDYDRGAKLIHYQFLPSLREVLFVSHREPRLTLHRRVDASWPVADYRAGETVEILSLGARIAVDEVYSDGLEDLIAPFPIDP